MANTIKSEFGVMLRAARDARKLSRANLARRLGISAKTIQSWESGRTFIERLDLIPQLEAELECSLSGLIARAAGSHSPTLPDSDSGPSESIGTALREKLHTRPGPLAVKFIPVPGLPPGRPVDPERLEAEWVALPLLKMSILAKPVASLELRDVVRHVLIPREWVPRASILVASRVSDSAMQPVLPLGSTVIINLRPQSPAALAGRPVLLDLAERGTRIRQLEPNSGSGGSGFQVTGISARQRFSFKPEQGDRILGTVVGVLTQL
ncbi:MAG: helix-turn-helix domain-containing protein [Planctomycetota bacterium]|jgi:transcriptional regulator with XRE-family HTH domain|nr:helix-turn-helix domain-containing protein [Planctomycetota bacterium]